MNNFLLKGLKISTIMLFSFLTGLLAVALSLNIIGGFFLGCAMGILCGTLLIYRRGAIDD